MNLIDVKNEFAQSVTKLTAYCDTGDIKIENIESIRKIIDKTTFEIVVIGEFSSGKSTIINALLEEELLPTLLEPTTAKITYLSFSEQPYIHVKSKDGHIERKEFDAAFLKNLTVSSKELINDIDSLEVFLDKPILKRGIRIIDTPGTNDIDEDRVAITYNLLPEADAVIYISTYPVTSSNIKVFKDHILGNNIKSLFFVLNKIDLMANNAELQILDARQYFEKLVGQDIERFYTVSAIDYLEGIQDADAAQIQKSKFKEFRASLDSFIESSDKYEDLRTQYLQVFGKMKNNALSLIRMKIGGLSLSDEEFAKRKNSLKLDLDGFRDQVKDLENTTEVEIDKLQFKVHESLNTLLNEIVDLADQILSSPQGDIKLIIKDIELAVKQRFDDWKFRNEPLILEILKSLSSEISMRIMHTAQEISQAIVKFSGVSLEKYNPVQGSDFMSKVLHDDTKATMASTALVVGGMLVLSTLHLFAPLAFLLAPLFKSYRDKMLVQKREELKPQVITKLQEGYQTFSKEILNNIDLEKEKLLEQIREGLTSYRSKIQEQIQKIEEEKKLAESDLDNKISSLKNIVESIEKL